MGLFLGISWPTDTRLYRLRLCAAWREFSERAPSNCTDRPIWTNCQSAPEPHADTAKGIN